MLAEFLPSDDVEGWGALESDYDAGFLLARAEAPAQEQAPRANAVERAPRSPNASLRRGPPPVPSTGPQTHARATQSARLAAGTRPQDSERAGRDAARCGGGQGRVYSRDGWQWEVVPPSKPAASGVRLEPLRPAADLEPEREQEYTARPLAPAAHPAAAKASAQAAAAAEPRRAARVDEPLVMLGGAAPNPFTSLGLPLPAPASHYAAAAPTNAAAPPAPPKRAAPGPVPVPVPPPMASARSRGVSDPEQMLRRQRQLERLEVSHARPAIVSAARLFSMFAAAR